MLFLCLIANTSAFEVPGLLVRSLPCKNWNAFIFLFFACHLTSKWKFCVFFASIKSVTGGEHRELLFTVVLHVAKVKNICLRSEYLHICKSKSATFIHSSESQLAWSFCSTKFTRLFPQPVELGVWTPSQNIPFQWYKNSPCSRLWPQERMMHVSPLVSFIMQWGSRFSTHRLTYVIG